MTTPNNQWTLESFSALIDRIAADGMPMVDSMLGGRVDFDRNKIREMIAASVFADCMPAGNA